MATIIVTRDQTGKLAGFGERDKPAWGKFIAAMRDLKPGELMTVSHWFPRSGPFHRRHFAMLAAVYEAQEQFDDIEMFRAWVQVGAGHVRFVPGPTGRMVALPESVAWHKLDEAEFEAHHAKVIAFLRSPHATSFLWPHLSPADQSQMIESVLGDFGA